MVRLVFHQPLRQTEGLLASLLELLELDLPVPWADADRRHVYHVYGVRVPARDAVQTQLAAAGIATNIHYPVPVHLQPAYADLGYRRGDFPESERFGAEALSLPMFPELTEVQIERVCAALNEAGHVCAA